MREIIMERQKIMLTRSRNLRKRMTTEENTLWYRFLRTYPLQFRRQYVIGNYIVDFYCYRARLIVELDGSQHCDPEGIQYDKYRTEFLENQGYQVIRISNLDVVSQFPSVCEYIDSVAQMRAKEING